MAELGRLDVAAFQSEEKLPVALVLENIRSALNVGSVFRSADAFRITTLVLAGITATPPHKEIMKTALGSQLSVGWKYFPTAAKAIEFLKSEGWKIVAVEQTDSSTGLHQFHFLKGEKIAFVLGNEVEGVSDEALALTSDSIEIPQLGTKHSLNVAVCAGIVLWEAAKRLQFDNKIF